MDHIGEILIEVADLAMGADLENLTWNERGAAIWQAFELGEQRARILAHRDAVIELLTKEVIMLAKEMVWKKICPSAYATTCVHFGNGIDRAVCRRCWIAWAEQKVKKGGPA